MPLKNTPETLNILDPDFRMPEHCGGDRWSILHGDSLQIIRQFEPNSFDAIITDPPYASGGSSQTTKNRSTSEKYSSMSKDKALPDFDSDQMDQLSWMFWTAAWLQDARRIAKPGAPVCLFIDWRQLPAMTLALQWAGWTWRGVAVWDIHSHIVWNSVSRIDGKKYHSNGKSYVTEIRAVSDELCRKYKLSVIDTENSNHVAKPYAEWLAEKNGQPTWRTAIRQDVDEAIRQSLTWWQFLTALERKGYEVRMGRKYPVLRPPGKERFVRFKTLGKRYTPEAIRTRILYPQFNRCFVENSPRVQYCRLHSGKKPRRKLTGLRALYYRYLYELGALPRKPRRPSYAVRQDAYKLDQRIRQMEFLSKHNIDTLEQLETHRKALQTEIGQLQTKRKQLPKTDDVQSQCESVNTALKQLRQEERLCRKIAEHSLEVQQHLTEARRDRAEQQKQEQERARDRRPDITTR